MLDNIYGDYFILLVDENIEVNLPSGGYLKLAEYTDAGNIKILANNDVMDIIFEHYEDMLFMGNEVTVNLMEV